MGRFVTGWLGLGFKFLVVEFLGGPLERVFLRSSGDCTKPVFRVPANLLQMGFLHSSGFVYARAVALERVCWRSSGQYFLDISYGRVKSTLERTGFRARADVLFSCVLALERG